MTSKYKHALIKEIAAQQSGYEPSYVWGRITEPLPKEQREAAEIIMNTTDPLNIPRGPPLTRVKQVANRFLRSLPEDSTIGKKALN